MIRTRACTSYGSPSKHCACEGERGQNGRFDRKFYGPYYSEKSGDYSFKLAFPVWAERKQPSRTDKLKLDRASLFGGVYSTRSKALLAFEATNDNIFDKVVAGLSRRIAPSVVSGQAPCQEHVITGDAIDNIPGVPGVGPKTAAALLKAYVDATRNFKPPLHRPTLARPR